MVSPGVLPCRISIHSRSSSRELRLIGYQLFSVAYFSRGVLPQKRNGQRAPSWGTWPRDTHLLWAKKPKTAQKEGEGHLGEGKLWSSKGRITRLQEGPLCEKVNNCLWVQFGDSELFRNKVDKVQRSYLGIHQNKKPMSRSKEMEDSRTYHRTAPHSLPCSWRTPGSSWAPFVTAILDTPSSVTAAFQPPAPWLTLPPGLALLVLARTTSRASKCAALAAQATAASARVTLAVDGSEGEEAAMVNQDLR